MWKDDDRELPQLVREIKQEAEELIRLTDKAFLRSCKIAWDKDFEQSPGIAKAIRPLGLRHSLRSFLWRLTGRLRFH